MRHLSPEASAVCPTPLAAKGRAGQAPVHLHLPAQACASSTQALRGHPVSGDQLSPYGTPINKKGKNTAP